MPHVSLSDAFSEATPAACKALLAKGIRFVTAVETRSGEWFLLHAYDQDHAGVLARNWVDTMSARGASCWRIFEYGLSSHSFFTIFAQPEWGDC